MDLSSPEMLAALQQDLQVLKKPLGQAADTIVDEGVSKYPIFVVHQQEVSIGLPLIPASPESHFWAAHASTLEEFVTKNIIGEERVEEFKKVFKPVQEQLCLFVLSQIGATFIFLPRT